MKKIYVLMVIALAMFTAPFAQQLKAQQQEADIVVTLKDGPLAPGDFTPQQLVGVVCLYCEGVVQFKGGDLTPVMAGHIDLQSKNGKDLCTIDLTDMSTLTGSVKIAEGVTAEDNIFCKIGSASKVMLKMIPLSVIGLEGDANQYLGDAKTVALKFDVDRKESTAVKSIAAETSVNTAVYNLQGQRIAMPADGSQLPRGLYIVNGRKVVRN